VQRGHVQRGHVQRGHVQRGHVQRGQSLTNNTSSSYQKILNPGMDHFEDLVGWVVAAFVAGSFVLHGLVEHDEQALQLGGLAFKFEDENT